MTYQMLESRLMFCMDLCMKGIRDLYLDLAGVGSHQNFFDEKVLKMSSKR